VSRYGIKAVAKASIDTARHASGYVPARGIAKTAKAKPKPNKARALGDAHVARIDEQAPDLEKKLNAARKAWLKQFWSDSGIADTKKSSTDDTGDGGDDGDQPVYEDDAGVAITVEEAAALKKIVAALTGNGYAQALYDEMSLALEAGYISGGEIIKEASTIEASFDVVPAETLAAIKDQADKFAFLVNEREQQQLYSLIDGAIADGQTIGDLAGAVKDSFAEGYHVTNSDGDVVQRIPTDSWSEMVARTELNRAQTFGQMAVYTDAGIQKVVWMSNHGATVCDDCDELDGTVVELGDDFPGAGTDGPPLHPNCCCNLLPADEDVMYPGVQEMIDDKEAA
jgi:SPP1 gp7 family putative phage head morphogenesis protein